MEITKNEDDPVNIDYKEITQNYREISKKQHLFFEDEESCGCIPQENKPGCGANCVVRMLQVECNPETCPCKDKCTNQRFQKKLYPKLEVFNAGAKGNGVRAKEFITRGQFIIEYVGEVIDTNTCKERMKNSGQQHFYFITLNATQGIDATSMGNIARYINHSCEPNCVTEKWTVRGEECVGIFAKEDIRPGTELTFDYQFQRTGTEKQECLCGSDNCRRYLGARAVKPPKIGSKHKEKFSKHNLYVNKITKEYSHYDAVQKSMRVAPFVFNSHNMIEGAPRPVFLKRNYRVQRTLILETFASMIHNEVHKKRSQRAEEESKRAKLRNISKNFMMNLDIELCLKNKQIVLETDTPSQSLPSKKRNQ